MILARQIQTFIRINQIEILHILSRLFWKWGKFIFEKMKIMINIYKT